MGYFANSTESDMYMDAFCSKCVHGEDGGCMVMFLHVLHNYDDCNKADSPLHVLIPRAKAPYYGNEKCTMFHAKPEAPTPPRLFSHCPQCGELYHGGACFTITSTDHP